MIIRKTYRFRIVTLGYVYARQQIVYNVAQKVSIIASGIMTRQLMSISDRTQAIGWLSERPREMEIRRFWGASYLGSFNEGDLHVLNPIRSWEFWSSRDFGLIHENS